LCFDLFKLIPYSYYSSTCFGQQCCRLQQAGLRFTKRKQLCFPAEYTAMQATAHSTKLRSSLRFLELCYAYHYRYANNYWLVGDLNKESKYKKDKKCKNKQNTRHTYLLTSSTASNITPTHLSRQSVFPSSNVLNNLRCFVLR